MWQLQGTEYSRFSPVLKAILSSSQYGQVRVRVLSYRFKMNGHTAALIRLFFAYLIMTRLYSINRKLYGHISHFWISGGARPFSGQRQSLRHTKSLIFRIWYVFSGGARSFSGQRQSPRHTRSLIFRIWYVFSGGARSFSGQRQSPRHTKS